MTQEINLLGPHLRRRRTSASSAIVLGPVLLLAVVIGLGLGVYFKHQVRDLRARHALAEEDIRKSQEEQRKLAQDVAQIKKDPALEAEAVQLEKRLLAVQLDLAALNDGAIGDTRGFSDFMRALAHQGVDGVWVTGFNVGAAGKDIAISGRALRAELVPAYLKRLGQDPYFSGRTFASLDVAQPPSQPRVDAVSDIGLVFRLLSRRELGSSSGGAADAAGAMPR